MKALRGIGLALGVLLVIWGSLAAVAYFAGVLPKTTPPAVSTVDAGIAMDAAIVADASTTTALTTTAATDSVAADAAADAAAPAPPSAWQVCPAGTTYVRAWRAEVLVDATEQVPSEEVVVSCGSSLSVIAFDRTSIGVEPRRVLTVTAPVPPGAHRQPPTITSFAAGRFRVMQGIDLVVGFRDEGGTGSGGMLAYFARERTGGYARAHIIATIAIADLHVMRDDQTGDDLLVLNAGNERARRPAELWTYDMQPTPTRKSVGQTIIGGAELWAGPTTDDTRTLAIVRPVGGGDGFRAYFGDAAGAWTPLTESERAGLISTTASKVLDASDRREGVALQMNVDVVPGVSRSVMILAGTPTRGPALALLEPTGAAGAVVLADDVPMLRDAPLVLSLEVP